MYLKLVASWSESLFSLRLHQTEEKSKVHGCLKSNKFLVAEGYTVKVLKPVHAGMAGGIQSVGDGGD